jgi:hypothetical protein
MANGNQTTINEIQETGMPGVVRQELTNPLIPDICKRCALKVAGQINFRVFFSEHLAPTNKPGDPEVTTDELHIRTCLLCHAIPGCLTKKTLFYSSNVQVGLEPTPDLANNLTPCGLYYNVTPRAKAL